MRSVKIIIKTLAVLVILVVLAYAAIYSYFLMQITFKWQCQIYTGELTPEGAAVCQDYRDGGLRKVIF